jgi:hypothetical protein
MIKNVLHLISAKECGKERGKEAFPVGERNPT